MPTSTKLLTAGDFRVALATIPDHVPLCIYASIAMPAGAPHTIEHVDVELKPTDIQISIHRVKVFAEE